MFDRTICIVLVSALLLVPACGGSNSPAPFVVTAAALTAMQQLVPSTPEDVEARFLATSVVAAVGILVLHTFLSVPPKIPPANWTEIAHYGVITAFLTLVFLRTLFGTSAVQQTGQDPLFPLGQGPNGYTVQANMPELMPEGDYHIFHFSCEGIIPAVSADPTVLYQYAFVMDADGNSSNNYTTSDNDFFNDTDRWYEMSYSNDTGWVLRVKTAIDGNIQEVSSAARVIITENAMILVVPASEFAVSNPSYRVTTFCHTGDFGINPPHSWSGDLHPPVAAGLAPFPAQN